MVVVNVPEIATQTGQGYWLAGAIFAISFVLIISEKVDKTKAALAGGAAMIGFSVLTQVEAFHSLHFGIDYNVIFLLISMMVIVNITSKSGVFDYVAIKSAKMAHGRPLPIMITYIIFTAIASAFLDNVTTVLLMAPVTLLIADELDIDPVPFLIAEALASNIGGTSTLIGDPPNIIIASKAGFGFMDFLINLGPPVLLIMTLFVAIVWLFMGRKLKVDEAKRSRIMKMNADRLIKDRVLARKSLIVLGLTILGFMVHSWLGFEPATIALIGAALLLLITREDPHEVFSSVEWPTIFFFIGLFILVGGIVKVGLINDVSRFVIDATNPTEDSMYLTSMTLLWVSGILSSLVDNIPYVATMSPLILDVASTVFHEGNVPAASLTSATLHHEVLSPVWWSLALGSCLGGNGSAIGASANVIVLGIARRSGRPISFLKFTAYGLPTMIGTLLVSHIYLWLRYF